MTLEQAQAIIAVALNKYQLAQRKLQRAQHNPTQVDMLKILTDNTYVDKLKLNAERKLKAVEYWECIVKRKQYNVYDFAYIGKKYNLNG